MVVGRSSLLHPTATFTGISERTGGWSAKFAKRANARARRTATAGGDGARALRDLRNLRVESSLCLRSELHRHPDAKACWKQTKSFTFRMGGTVEPSQLA